MALYIPQSKKKALHIPQSKKKIKEEPKKAEKNKENFLSFLNFGQRVSGKEFILFTSQMALMLDTGYSLNKALEIFARQVQHPYFKEVITHVIEEIESGKLFSDGLAKYPHVFSPLFINIVRVGENGGFLKKMIEQLANYYTEREEYLNAIKKALIYPSILMAFSLFVIMFIMVYVFPKLSGFLQGKESILPITTRFFMASSAFLQNYWYAVIIALPVLIVSFIVLIKMPKIASFIERIRMKIPIINKLYLEFYTSHFLSNLGFLLDGGVPLLDALKTTKKIVQSSMYQNFIDELIESVETGAGFSTPFQKQTFLPIAVKEMVQTGEETGNLNTISLRLGDRYAKDFRKGMEVFCTILEPIIIVGMGVVVGVIVLSIIIPIFRISSGVN
ncbi:MAG: type II secretion system F family protein [Deltaproteobacteria bacterium]|nr:type II secretion system F family protein [Deltaproteobacteria bacterium]